MSCPVFRTTPTGRPWLWRAFATWLAVCTQMSSSEEITPVWAHWKYSMTVTITRWKKGVSEKKSDRYFFNIIHNLHKPKRKSLCLSCFLAAGLPLSSRCWQVQWILKPPGGEKWNWKGPWKSGSLHWKSHIQKNNPSQTMGLYWSIQWLIEQQLQTGPLRTNDHEPKGPQHLSCGEGGGAHTCLGRDVKARRHNHHKNLYNARS